MTARRRLRLLALAVVAILPPALKPPIYRCIFGYQVGRHVRIGISVIEAGDCEIADGVTIGHGNLMFGVRHLSIGEHAHIGHLNLIRGGDQVSLGRWTHIIRLNELNSIPNPVLVNTAHPQLIVGAGCVITAGHKIDFTDRVVLGRRVIIGGRSSSIWTHNRQRTAPVRIGEMTYVGSETRFAPGAEVGRRCVVGMGSVVVDRLDAEAQLIAGVPARAVRPLRARDLFLVERKTRDDMPEDV